VGISATGSGKTLAFLLPAMIHINAQVSGFWGIPPLWVLLSLGWQIDQKKRGKNPFFLFLSLSCKQHKFLSCLGITSTAWN
jgi:superfamily II DNA/RNA helicase